MSSLSKEEPLSAESAALTHKVLVNDEEQYCIWPAAKTVPAGWRSVFTGSHAYCVAHVDDVWTDMRPKSVRD